MRKRKRRANLSKIPAPPPESLPRTREVPLTQVPIETWQLTQELLEAYRMLSGYFRGYHTSPPTYRREP